MRRNLGLRAIALTLAFAFWFLVNASQRGSTTQLDVPLGLSLAAGRIGDSAIGLVGGGLQLMARKRSPVPKVAAHQGLGNLCTGRYATTAWHESDDG
jgi:hypothetical protein